MVSVFRKLGQEHYHKFEARLGSRVKSLSPKEDSKGWPVLAWNKLFISSQVAVGKFSVILQGSIKI